MLRCIIVEDEPLAVKILTGYIAQVPFLQLEATFRDALTASDYLRTNSPDLMFLDIHLPHLKGLDFLQTLHQRPTVIVTTAYHQYAVESYNLDVTDYLLKPFGFERFLRAINKIRPPQPEPAATPTERDYFFVTVQKKKVKVLFSEIAYIESQREYIRIVTDKKELLTKMSTHEIAALLPSDRFKRIHRSFIIALEKIESYTAESIDIQGLALPIGREYRMILEEL